MKGRPFGSTTAMASPSRRPTDRRPWTRRLATASSSPAVGSSPSGSTTARCDGSSRASAQNPVVTRPNARSGAGYGDQADLVLGAVDEERPAAVGLEAGDHVAGGRGREVEGLGRLVGL